MSRSRRCAWWARAHGVGEGIVPGALVLDGVALREAGGERLDQGAFRRGDAVGEGQRGLGGIIGAGEGAGLGIGVPHLPREIVVGADGVGDAPMGHGAVRVGCQRGFEAVDCLLVVEAKAPVQAAVEPKLRGRGCGGDLAGVGSEIVGVVVHVASLPSVGRAEASGLWRYCHGRNNLALSDATARPCMLRSARHETSEWAPLPGNARPHRRRATNNGRSPAKPIVAPSSSTATPRNSWVVIRRCLQRVRAHPRRRRPGTERCSRFSYGRAGHCHVSPVWRPDWRPTRLTA